MLSLSVIIPTLNEERVLESVLLHTADVPVMEIIVVDGGSVDGTKRVVEAIRRRRPALSIQWIESSPGRGRQMNTGAAKARGQTLLFLHADTRLPTDAAQAIARALEDPEYIGGRFDVRFDRDRGWPWLIARLMNWRSRWSGIATGDQAMFVRKDVFDHLGGFAEIPIMEDIDFSRRLKRAGRTRALRATVVTSYRRWARCGTVRTVVLMWCMRFLYWIGISPQHLSEFYGSVR